MSFLIQQTLIYAVPLMIVALAGVFAERSGIINLALEGIMIFGAFIGVLFVRQMQGLEVFNAAKAAGDWGTLQGLVLLAMLVSAAMGALFSLLLSFASINLRADQTIGGTALNLLAPALVLFFIRIIANQNTLNMASGDSASWFMIKKSTLGIDRSVDLGFFGETFINKVYLATYVCILVFIILSILLYKTRFGLRLRACGENPQAADSLGINVYKMRYAGTTISGALAGQLLVQQRRGGLRLIGPRGHDLRQLEAAEHRGRVAAVRPVQVHRRGLHQPRHQRRRRVSARADRHQRALLSDAAVPHHDHRARLYVQELPRPQGRGHPLRQGQPLSQATVPLRTCRASGRCVPFCRPDLIAHVFLSKSHKQNVHFL